VTETRTDRVPLGRRGPGQPTTQPLVEGVPDFLYLPLRDWLFSALQDTRPPAMTYRPSGDLTNETKKVMLLVRSSEQPWSLPASDPQTYDGSPGATP
jgi:hypothetical protein